MATSRVARRSRTIGAANDPSVEALPFGSRDRSASSRQWPIGVNPVGSARVVLFNYGVGETAEMVAPDVVLVRPNETSSGVYYAGRFWENLGVLTLTRHLEQNGVRLGVVEGSLFQCTPELTADLATRYRPRVIGISVYCTFMLQHCLDLAVLIKERQPDAVIVLGGHGASFVPADILEHNDAVSAVIGGEGEDGLLGLVRAAGPEEWATVPSLSYRRDGVVRSNPRGPVLKDYDQAPIPHRFARDIMLGDPVLSQAPLMMVSSKGCFDRCAFCTVTAFYAGGWKGRSPVHVVDELESMLQRYGRANLHFWDDTFTGPGQIGKRRAIGIADEIKRRGLKLAFHVTTRPSDLTEEVVAALASAGMRSVFIGVESSQQSVLKEFDKHATVEDSTVAIERLMRHGVRRILVGFILFHPTMTWTSFYGDLDLLDGLPSVESPRILSRLVYYPGSQLWLEHRSELGDDAYKRPFFPRLPSDEFETLYRSCANFFRQTMELEMVIVCLEERYLGDQAIIAMLATCRTRLFRFLSARARLVADHLRLGRDHEGDFERSCDEIFVESLSIVRDLERALGDAYFDRLLDAFQLVGYERYLKRPEETASGTSPMTASM